MDTSYTNDQAVLLDELDLLESMFSSTFTSSSSASNDEKGCCTVVERKPRFIFHINLTATSKSKYMSY